MVKPNYAFAKRQRDLAKQAKNEEKRKKKADLNAPPSPETDEPPKDEEKQQS